MDDPSLLPYLNSNTNGNGHHYGMEIDDDDDDDDELDEQQYPEDDIDDEREIYIPPPPSITLPSQERGGRRKGVPRRLQISPPKVKSPSPPRQQQKQQQQCSLPIAKPSSSTNQAIVTSDEELNNENDHNHQEIKHSNDIEFDYYPSTRYFDDEEYDENNNMNIIEDENIFEIVDDILADIVTIIVRDIRQQRQKTFKQRLTQQTNGHMKIQEKYSNGKHSHTSNSIKQSKRLSDPSTLLNEFTKNIPPTSSTQINVKTNTSPPLPKRQKITDSTLSLQRQQQLFWQMTQQLMLGNTSDDIAENSSLLKQQLLGLTAASSSTMPKRVGRPPKQQVQSPQVMRSSTNMMPTISNSTSYERANFAPRRRGRPPKYVTERGAIPALTSHELEPMPYDQLFAAIENSVTGNSSRTSSAAFQSALASMLGQQSGLPIPTLSIPAPPPPPPPPPRNGVPASMVKQSAGQTRHSLPTSTNGSSMPLMATKKRGPGRPPKSQLLIDSHQVLQATKRINSPSSLSNTVNNNNNHFPPTMVPSSPTSFSLNAAFVEMLQQQQHQR